MASHESRCTRQPAERPQLRRPQLRRPQLRRPQLRRPQLRRPRGGRGSEEGQRQRRWRVWAWIVQEVSRCQVGWFVECCLVAALDGSIWWQHACLAGGWWEGGSGQQTMQDDGAGMPRQARACRASCLGDGGAAQVLRKHISILKHRTLNDRGVLVVSLSHRMTRYHHTLQRTAQFGTRSLPDVAREAHVRRVMTRPASERASRQDSRHGAH